MSKVYTKWSTMSRENMPRKEPARRLRISEELCRRLEERKTHLRRQEDLSPFVEWILALYLDGLLIESGEVKEVHATRVRRVHVGEQRKTA